MLEATNRSNRKRDARCSVAAPHGARLLCILGLLHNVFDAPPPIVVAILVLARGVRECKRRTGEPDT